MLIMHHIIAMKRSGQHGVINWLAGQYRDAGYQPLVYNNKGINVLKRAVGYMAQWVYPVWNLRRRDDKDRLTTSVIINNYEDELASTIIPHIMAYASCPPFSAYEHRIWINLRDPYNCFASRFQNPEVRAWVTDEQMRALWLDHATINSNRTFQDNYQGLAWLKQKEFRMEIAGGVIEELPPPVTYILFNKWFADETYRRSIAECLGLAFTDRGRDKIGRYGSSFDGLKYEGKARQMNVLDRWRRWQDHPDYRDQLTPEIVAHARRIFGKLEAEQMFEESK